MNRTLFFILFLFFSISSFCQEKTIEIHIPTGGITSIIDDQVYTYIIRTNNDGIVCSISSPDNHTYTATEVNYNNDRITLNKGEIGLAINEILNAEGGILVRGVPSSIYTKNGEDFTYISINENQNILFEHDEQKLLKLSEKSLETIFKVNPSNFISISFLNNTSYIDYRYKGNTMNKNIYNENDNGYSITYCNLDYEYCVDGIEVYGDNLYSFDTRKNVINFFILLSVDNLIAQYLFPMIFLEHPFSFNNSSNELSYNIKHETHNRAEIYYFQKLEFVLTVGLKKYKRLLKMSCSKINVFDAQFIKKREE